MSRMHSRIAVCAFSFSALTVAGSMLWPVEAQAESPPHVDMAWPHPQPAYPGSALASGEQGTVLVNLYVRPDGKVEKYRVAQSSGFGDLDDAAVEDVLNWHFVPAERDGDIVSDWTTVKIVLELPQPPLRQSPSLPK